MVSAPLCQRDLFGRVAIAEKTVQADHYRWLVCFRQMECTVELNVVTAKGNGLDIQIYSWSLPLFEKEVRQAPATIYFRCFLRAIDYLRNIFRNYGQLKKI